MTFSSCQHDRTAMVMGKVPSEALFVVSKRFAHNSVQILPAVSESNEYKDSKEEKYKRKQSISSTDDHGSRRKGTKSEYRATQSGDPGNEGIYGRK